MKNKFTLLIIAIIAIIFYFVEQNSMIFVYRNPYTNTEPFSYIAKSIRDLDRGFKYAKSSSAKDGYKYKYLYFNAYGSGFVKDNNISNDLDYAVGIDLGKYVYDGKNAAEIAENIINKMDSFYTCFNLGIRALNNSHTYTVETPFEQAANLARLYRGSVKNIEKSIDTALSEQGYVTYTVKDLEDENGKERVDVRYIMMPGEILVEERKPIKLYSDTVSYNPYNLHYLREISIIPEFYVTIKKDNIAKTIEIVPESFLGERLQLKRRIYASCIFVHNSSYKYINELNFYNDDNEYLFYRLLSFKRHLQDINNINLLQERPIKLFKRLAQTADMIQPLLSPEMYASIKQYSAENLNNKEIVLLNDYQNICGNLANILEHPKFFLQMKENGQISKMLDNLRFVVDSLEKDNKVAKSEINVMKAYQTELEQLLSLKYEEDVYVFDEKNFAEKYTNMKEAWKKAVVSQTKDTGKTFEFIKLYDKIYADAGYHRVTLCWLDNSTVGVIEDSFTKNIKDLKKFAKDNNLVDINYVLIKESNVPKYSAHYDIFARYNTTQKEEDNFAKFNEALLKDKPNFNTKRKFVFIK